MRVRLLSPGQHDPGADRRDHDKGEEPERAQRIWRLRPRRIDDIGDVYIQTRQQSVGRVIDAEKGGEDDCDDADDLQRRQGCGAQGAGRRAAGAPEQIGPPDEAEIEGRFRRPDRAESPRSNGRRRATAARPAGRDSRHRMNSSKAASGMNRRPPVEGKLQGPRKLRGIGRPHHAGRGGREHGGGIGPGIRRACAG